MPWPPDIAEQLPAPRDDEPADLRHDIADELADHLQCAFVRELHATRDEESAKGNVLDRFGNPATIATKLWFDAMWEKIMSQRLNLIVASLMAVVCIATLVAIGLMVREFQAVNTALISRLEAMGNAASEKEASKRSFEWQHVRLKLVADKPGGSPLSSFRVSLDGKLLGSDESISIERKSDSAGVVDFGLIRVGQFLLMVRAPWGEYLPDEKFVVSPAMSSVLEIVCPGGPPGSGKVELGLQWPTDVREALSQKRSDLPTDALRMWTYLEFWGRPRLVGENFWRRSDDDSLRLLIDSAGQTFLLGQGDHVEPLNNQRNSFGFCDKGLHFAAGIQIRIAQVPTREDTFPAIARQYVPAQMVVFAAGSIDAIVQPQPRHSSGYLYRWSLDSIFQPEAHAPPLHSDWVVDAQREVSHWKFVAPDELVNQFRPPEDKRD